MVVTSEHGKFLLKRRPRGKDDLYHVGFTHTVQTYLAKEAFPVVSLVTTRDQNNTILQLNSHIYELFEFVSGTRYDGSSEATIDAGRQLAKFHRHLIDFAAHWEPLRGGFHDSSTVRRHLKAVGAERTTVANKELQGTAESFSWFFSSSITSR